MNDHYYTNSDGIYEAIDWLLPKPNWWRKRDYRVHMLDRKYKCVNVETLTEWSHDLASRQPEYVADYYDCDNFAFRMRTRAVEELGINSVGVVISYDEAHAYNCAACYNGSELVIVFIEPQTGKTLPTSSFTGAFKRGLIIM